MCSLSLVCVAGVGAGESDLMCRILFITRSFFPVKLCPSTGQKSGSRQVKSCASLVYSARGRAAARPRGGEGGWGPM